MANPIRLVFVQNARREWYWRAVAGNNEELARSSETYAHRSDMEACALQVVGQVRYEAMSKTVIPFIEEST